MHIIIGLLTAVAGLFYALTKLQNSGAIDALNPFLWYRRAQWSKKLNTKPIYTLSEPVDVAGLLIVAIAKLEGDLSREQKNEILMIFEKEFHLNKRDSQYLFNSSLFLIKDEMLSSKDISNIFEKSKSKFTSVQIDSLLSLMLQVSKIDSETNIEQKKIIDTSLSYFQVLNNNQKW